MLPILNIGPLAIQLPGLLILAGLWLGLSLSERLLAQRPKAGLDGDQLNSLMLWGLGAGLLGARLGYILSNPAAFSLNWLNAFSLNPNLLDPLFGLLAGALTIVALAQRRNLALSLLLDALTPGLAVFSVFFFLANLASGAGFGLPTQLPWAVDLYGASRHPAQIYDSLAAAAILAVLWWRRNDFALGTGRFFLTFVAASSAARLFLDAFHATGATHPGWRLVQIVAWLLLTASLWLLRPKAA